MDQSKQEGLIRFCRDLIRIPSYSGKEEHVVAKIRMVMEELGFDQVWVDSYGSVLGKINGTGVRAEAPGKRRKKILLDGHIDTVETGDDSKWSHSPFGAEIDGPKIYGRGASDMKGAVAAMIFGASHFCKERIESDIYVCGTVQEEIFEGIALAKVIDAITPDYVIIGEASNLDLKTGQRGRAELILYTYGKSCHSSNPCYGKNAVYEMISLTEKIRNRTLTVSKELGEGILELTDIISLPYPGSSVVPDQCRATYDRRLLTGESEDSVLQELEAMISRCTDEDPDFSGKAVIAKESHTCYTGTTISGTRFFPAWYFAPTEPFVQSAYRGLIDAGLRPKFDTYSFCTNGSSSAGVYQLPTLGFGPSQEHLAHIVDEYIEIDQLIGAAEGYQGIIDAWNRDL